MVNLLRTYVLVQCNYRICVFDPFQGILATAVVVGRKRSLLTRRRFSCIRRLEGDPEFARQNAVHQVVLKTCTKILYSLILSFLLVYDINYYIFFRLCYTKARINICLCHLYLWQLHTHVPIGACLLPIARACLFSCTCACVEWPEYINCRCSLHVKLLEAAK